MNPVPIEYHCVGCGRERSPECVRGDPPEPCECGEVALAASISGRAEGRSTASANAAITWNRPPRDWRSRWKQMQDDLAALKADRHNEISAQSLKDAEQQLLRFLVECWNFKDSLAARVDRHVVEAGAKASPCLMLVADLANLEKHTTLTRGHRSGSLPEWLPPLGQTVAKNTWRFHGRIRHDGREIDVTELACEAVDAWRELLAAWRLL